MVICHYAKKGLFPVADVPVELALQAKGSLLPV